MEVPGIPFSLIKATIYCSQAYSRVGLAPMATNTHACFYMYLYSALFTVAVAIVSVYERA